MKIKTKKLFKYDSSLLFLSATILFVILSIITYFAIKKFIYNEADIFVATPSGSATLSFFPSGSVAITPGGTRQISVIINGIPSGRQISAIGFSLQLKNATASALTVTTPLSGAEVKQFFVEGDKLNYVVATKYATPLTLTNGTAIATLTLTAPSTAGTYSNVLTSVTTTTLPSIIDSNRAEIMNSTNSFAPISFVVSTPALSAPVFNITTDTVYNGTIAVTTTLPNNPGGVTLTYCITATRVSCNASTPVPTTGIISVNSTGYIYVVATKPGYTGSNAFSPKLILNDNPTIASVTLSGPSGNASSFISGQPITITANGVSDSINGVTKVSFYRDTTFLGEDTTSPYTFTYNGAPIGAYSIKATAVDAFGGSTSLTVRVTVKPKAPTFTPNGGTGPTPFTVTINNPNSTGTVKYSLGNNVTPATTYTAPITISTSNIITANVTVNNVASDNAISAQYTVTGKVATPVASPVQGNYHPSVLKTVTLASSTAGATIDYCIVEFTASTASTATCTPSIRYTSEITVPAKKNFKLISRASLPNWNTSDTSTSTYQILGDANLDNAINISDISATLLVLFNANSPTKTVTMDCNKTATGYGDGEVDLLDVLEIISLMFN